MLLFLQVQRLQQDQVHLEQAATEQINAALQEGLAAAAAAREEAEAGGSSALQEALDREAQLTAGIADLQAEHEARLFPVHLFLSTLRKPSSLKACPEFRPWWPSLTESISSFKKVVTENCRPYPVVAQKPNSRRLKLALF